MADILSNLIDHYKFDDGTGITATDSGSGAKHGTLTNGPTWGTGRIGGCVVFDGSNDLVALPASLGIDNIAALSIASWIKVGTAVDFATIFSHYFSDNERIEISLGGSGAGSNTGLLFTNAVGGAKYGYTAGSLIDTNWHHVVMVFDGALSGNARLVAYLDGAAVSLTYVSTQPAATTNNAASVTWIGRRNKTGGQLPWNGSLDEVRVYTRALTAADVAALYAYTGAVVSGAEVLVSSQLPVQATPQSFMLFDNVRARRRHNQ